MRIKCPKCGVVTSFVVDGEIIRRDFKVHGNRAESLSCFNCNVPLQMPVPEVKPEPTETPGGRDEREVLSPDASGQVPATTDVGGKFAGEVDRTVETIVEKPKKTRITKKAKRKT